MLVILYYFFNTSSISESFVIAVINDFVTIEHMPIAFGISFRHTTVTLFGQHRFLQGDQCFILKTPVFTWRAEIGVCSAETV